MSNTTNKNILYLDYKTSALASPNVSTSAVPTSTATIIMNRTVIVNKPIYPCKTQNK